MAFFRQPDGEFRNDDSADDIEKYVLLGEDGRKKNENSGNKGENAVAALDTGTPEQTAPAEIRDKTMHRGEKIVGGINAVDDAEQNLGREIARNLGSDVVGVKHAEEDAANDLRRDLCRYEAVADLLAFTRDHDVVDDPGDITQEIDVNAERYQRRCVINEDRQVKRNPVWEHS